MNTYKISIIETMEGEDEEEVMEAFCRFVCHDAGANWKVELLETLEGENKRMSEEEKTYIVNLTVKVTDRIRVYAKSIEAAKKGAKSLFFENMSEYQTVNAEIEQIEVI